MSKMNLKLPIIAASILSSGAFAEDSAKPLENPLEVKARVFAEYRYDATKDSIHKNGFEVTRSWFGFNYKYNENWSAMLAFDAVRGETYSITDADTGSKSGITRSSLDVYTKSAFIQRTCSCETHTWNMKFGLQPNSYTSLVESVTGSRFIFKSIAEESKVVVGHFGGASAQSGWMNGLINTSVMVHNGREGLNTVGDSDSGTATAFSLGTSYKMEGAGLNLLAQAYVEKLDRAVDTKDASPVQASTSNQAFLFGVKHSYADVSIEQATTQATGSEDKKVASGVALAAHVPDTAYGFVVRSMSSETTKSGVIVKNSSMSAGPTFNVVAGGKISTALVYETAKLESVEVGKMYSWKWQANF
jgi:hypothetical protein